MTARRSNATERRGVGITPRPTALSAAALAVALAGSGCADRNASTQPTILPGNQDTAAVAKGGALPHTPPAAGNIRPMVVTSTTTTTVTDTTVSGGAKTVGNGITATAPLALITPEDNPAIGAGKPPLEVVSVPMWLWAQTAAPTQTTIQNPTDVLDIKSDTSATVVDTVVVDEVDWFQDVAGTITTASKGLLGYMTCGGPGALPNRGPGVEFDPTMDPSNAGNKVPQACVSANATPYYSKNGSTTTEGVHTLQAIVSLHVEYTYTYTDKTGNLKTVKGPPIAVTNSPVVARTPFGGLRFRVGEIQALAVSS